MSRYHCPDCQISLYRSDKRKSPLVWSCPRCFKEFFRDILKPQPLPSIEEGQTGATICVGSDRIPCTVIEALHGGRVLRVREDLAVRTDDRGMSDSQDYEYHPNPEGAVRTFKVDSAGIYRSAILSCYGRWKMEGSSQLLVGERQKFYDYSF